MTDLYRAAKEKFPLNILVAFVVGIILGYFIATYVAGSSGQAIAVPVNNGDTIFVKSVQWNGYCSAEGDAAHIVNCNRAGADGWERLIISKVSGTGNLNSGDHIHLKAVQWNGYCTAEDAATHYTTCNRAKALGYEDFIIKKVSGTGTIYYGDQVTLYSTAWSKYCSADKDSTGTRHYLWCNRASAASWEYFVLQLQSSAAGAAAACIATTCTAKGATCGSISNGCGGTINCGTCGTNQVCTNNKCVATQTCGNGIKEGTESCDGDSIACAAGYSGTQLCNSDCSGYDSSRCAASCMDSDNGINYFKTGTASYGTQTSDDYCEQSCNRDTGVCVYTGNVIEYSCTSPSAIGAQAPRPCPLGCANGACTNYPTCTVVSGTPNHTCLGETCYPDYCSGNTPVTYSCVNNVITPTVGASCATSCTYGHCAVAPR